MIGWLALPCRLVAFILAVVVLGAAVAVAACDAAADWLEA